MSKVPVVIEESEESQVAQKEADDLTATVESINVIDDATDAQAKELITQIAQAKKRLKESLGFLVDDHKAAIKKVTIPFKLKTDNLDAARKTLDNKVIAYDNQKRIAAAKEQKRLDDLAAKREETRLARIEREAEKSGKSVEEVEAEQPIDFRPQPLIDTPEKTVKTESGSTTIIRKLVGEVVNEALVPANYKKMVIDQSKIDLAVANGTTTIAGVRIYEKAHTSARGR